MNYAKRNRQAPTVVYDYQIFSQQKFGGISRYFCEIASRIHAGAKWQSKVIAPVYFNDYLAQSTVPTYGVYLPAPHRRAERLFDLFNRHVEPLFFFRNKARILHQTYYSPAVPNCSAKRIVTVFDMIHELFPQYFSQRDLVISRYKRKAVEAASHVVCISRKTAEDLMEILAVPEEKITVTHLGFSPVFQSTTAGSRQPYVTPQGRPYLLYVGNRAGYKNFSGLLEAFATSKRLSNEFNLVSFGGPPFTLEETTRFHELGLGPDGVLHKQGDDQTLARVYQGARALVYPSRYEGFGIPPLEAMASECPVACSNTSCLPEILGPAAEYFDPLQIDSIRMAIERVALDETRRLELTAEGQTRCRIFSWQRCADETLDAYEKTLESFRD